MQGITIKDGYRFEPYGATETSELEGNKGMFADRRGFLDENKLLVLFADPGLLPIAELNKIDSSGGVTSKVVSMTPGQVTSIPENVDAHLGNDTAVNGKVLKDAMSIAGKGFTPTSIEITTHSIPERVEEYVDLDDYDITDEGEIVRVKKEEAKFKMMQSPIPASVVFYDDANKTYRHGIIAPVESSRMPYYDEVDAIKKTRFKLDDMLLVMQPCTPDDAREIIDISSQTGIVPWNYAIDPNFKPIKKIDLNKTPHLKAMNALGNSKSIDEFKGDAVLGFVAACARIPDSEECNETRCFIPKQGTTRGFLITKERIGDVLTCYSPPQNHEAYHTKKGFNAAARDLSVVTGMPLRSKKSPSAVTNMTTCVMKHDRSKWGWSTPGVMFKAGDEIVGYEGEKEFLVPGKA